MKLETPNQLGEAIRFNKTVMVYDREDGGLLARGILMGFDKETITLLEYSVGVVHFIRENVDVWELDEPVN